MTTKTHHFIPSHLLPRPNQFVVMVVDDMTVNRVLLNKILTGAGYAVIEAESGDAALENLRSPGLLPDVIITDVEMPGMDGITLTAKIRQMDGPASRIPVLVASGNPDSEMELDAYDCGADAFLSKPFNLAQLRDEVAGALTRDRNIQVSVRRFRSAKEMNELRTRL